MGLITCRQVWTEMLVIKEARLNQALFICISLAMCQSSQSQLQSCCLPQALAATSRAEAELGNSGRRGRSKATYAMNTWCRLGGAQNQACRNRYESRGRRKATDALLCIVA